MCDRLVDTMTGGSGADAPGAIYHNGHWGLHHEQVEMVENCFGQYEHNNQPVWHILYMFASAGCAAQGQYWLRQAFERFYRPGWYTGDEDNGSMSAWYILSALGFYQLVPGSTTYVLGSPLFRHVRLQLENGRVLDVVAEGNSPTNVYVQSASWNDTPLNSLTVDYAQLVGGGTLRFVMGPAASNFGVSHHDR